MRLTRKELVHTAAVGSAVEPEKARLMQLGRMRGGPTPTGGFFFEIVGNGQTRRAEATPREAMIIALAILETVANLRLPIDPNGFPHTNG